MKYYGEGNGNPLQYSCLKIPWIEKPDRLQSMGSQRVRHNWAYIRFKWSTIKIWEILKKKKNNQESILLLKTKKFLASNSPP